MKQIGQKYEGVFGEWRRQAGVVVIRHVGLWFEARLGRSVQVKV